LLARDILAGNDPYHFTVDLQRLWINKYERVEWLRDELGDALKRWAVGAPALVGAAPAPRLNVGTYPAAGSAPARSGTNRAWILGGGVLGAVLLLLAAFLIAPQWFTSAVQPQATQIAAQATSRPATRTPLPSAVPPTATAGDDSAAEIATTVTPTVPLTGVPPTAIAEAPGDFGRGVRIVFTRGTPGCSTLGLMTLDTGTLRTFNPAPNNEEPTWSPDGAHFIASTGDCRGGQYNLTIFDSTTGETVPLETNCNLAIDPFWGDDERIYFACGPRTGNGELFSVNPDGTDLRALGVSARRPTLSPDGKHLAYMLLEEEVWRIWVGELDEEGKLVNPQQMPFPQVLGGVYARQPKWSSDGTRLYFNITDQTSLAAMALASVELATGSTNVSFITADANTPFVRPVCGKDNVCVAGGASGGLWLLEEVGGALLPKRQLTFGEEYGADVFP
jgi:hypothetical protein